MRNFAVYFWLFLLVVSYAEFDNKTSGKQQSESSTMKEPVDTSYATVKIDSGTLVNSIFGPEAKSGDISIRALQKN